MLDDLPRAQAARQKSQYDLHRFRRRVATQTLADDAQCLGRTSGGTLVGDVYREIDDSGWKQLTETFFGMNATA